MFNFDLLKQAGISQSLFAELTGTSRVTVNSWVMGHTKPHNLYESTVRAKLDAIEKLLARGVLPVSLSLRDRNRNKTIARAIHEA